MERYLCTHCGKRFEAEAAETVICPACFWSTSVKKDEPGAAPVAQVKTPPAPRPESPRNWFWAGGAFLALLLVGVSFLAVRYLQKQETLLQKIEFKNARMIASQAPELALLPEEREILARKVSVEPGGELGQAEKDILSRRIIFRSRLPQGIPTPPWNEKEFEEFLKSQQHQYKISLEWTYQRKLKRLFKMHYPAASQAFESKDYLKARDEWIRSLAFPVYYNNPKKHRGVVLTMLRPYINDTLSKIGTMNALLTGQDLFAVEEKIRTDYGNLHGLLEKQSWEEANALLLELEKQLESVEKLPPPATPPPLPKETALVDADIREVILTQAAPVQPGTPDWAALGKDLEAKEKVIQSRLPSTLEEIQREYGEALLLIENKNWGEARERLQKIEFPEPLAEDARAKVAVLNKLAGEETSEGTPPLLDSNEKTS